MRIVRILSPVHSLGPGERVALWTQGCKKQCRGCISPEMQPSTGTDVDEETLADAVIRVAKNVGCTGLTVSGGDPFEQSDALLRFLKAVRGAFRDILVYTGFTVDEIRTGCAGDAGMDCLKHIDVLIDGRYVDELNRPDCVLKGSANQNIIFLNDELIPNYTEYMKRGRVLETFNHDRTIIITGIMNKE